MTDASLVQLLLRLRHLHAMKCALNELNKAAKSYRIVCGRNDGRKYETLQNIAIQKPTQNCGMMLSSRSYHDLFPSIFHSTLK